MCIVYDKTLTSFSTKNNSFFKVIKHVSDTEKTQLHISTNFKQNCFTIPFNHHP